MPYLVAADAAFYSGKNEAAAKAKGVKRVCIPNRSTKSPERKREQKKRWFRNGQKWRTGCEGRISVTKRRHGLNRCRYRGNVGMRRWVGLGVIADIPRSRHDPKILWVDDAEIVGDRITKVRPIPRNLFTQKTERRIGELGTSCVALVVSDVSVHEAP